MNIEKVKCPACGGSGQYKSAEITGAYKNGKCFFCNGRGLAPLSLGNESLIERNLVCEECGNSIFDAFYCGRYGIQLRCQKCGIRVLIYSFLALFPKIKVTVGESLNSFELTEEEKCLCIIREKKSS